MAATRKKTNFIPAETRTLVCSETLRRPSLTKPTSIWQFADPKLSWLLQLPPVSAAVQSLSDSSMGEVLQQLQPQLSSITCPWSNQTGDIVLQPHWWSEMSLGQLRCRGSGNQGHWWMWCAADEDRPRPVQCTLQFGWIQPFGLNRSFLSLQTAYSALCTAEVLGLPHFCLFSNQVFGRWRWTDTGLRLLLQSVLFKN